MGEADRVWAHLDAQGQPQMVDVSNKSASLRVATAQAIVQLPPALSTYIVGQDIYLEKGVVFQTAVIAGTMAVKKTEQLIPFCHQIPVESCTFDIKIDDRLLVTVHCTVKTSAKTGVEMEALCGASVAALTIYDMCKSVSPHICIRDTRLVTKSGGKNALLERPLYGLVLTGGQSKRMGRDKALLKHTGKPYAAYLYELLQPYCQRVYLSARAGQWLGTPLELLPTLPDQVESVGPISGLLTALNTHPEANWLVVACDLLNLQAKTIQKLLEHYQAETVATCYANPKLGFPEALCAIYTPQAAAVLRAAYAAGVYCPVKVLGDQPCTLVTPDCEAELMNVNTPEEYAAFERLLSPR
ncbi:cyclic pyranopterin monophosphate synthase MoaC [Synechococcus sp. H60.2]|uniref:cyclic pyranopterin monophosphate synthase MoaC n=1 Tax=Synechococcus sp. H60.2 TaxID=2964518 RepID=UPI0039C0D6D1